MSSLKITKDANFDNISINGSYNVPIVNSLIELQTMDTIGNIVFVNSENNFYFHLKNGWSPLGSGGGDIELPLTTKGDLLTYDTETTRLPVGTDNQILTADSSEATGVKWTELPAVVLGKLVSTTQLTLNGGASWNTAYSLPIIGTGRPVRITFCGAYRRITGSETWFSVFRDSTNLRTNARGIVFDLHGVSDFRALTLSVIDLDCPVGPVPYHFKYYNWSGSGNQFCHGNVDSIEFSVVQL